MATITPVITRVDSNGGRGFSVLWETVTENDTCTAVELGPHSDRSAQITGTFGSGNVSIEGSNDGTNYEILDDLGGTAITLSAAGLQGVGPLTRYIRPRTPTGTSVDVDVTVFVMGGSK